MVWSTCQWKKKYLNQFLSSSSKAKEKTYWEEHRSNKKTHYTVHFNGNVYACHIIYPLMNWDVSILPGDYSIPFSFKAPSNIPNSFGSLIKSAQF